MEIVKADLDQGVAADIWAIAAYHNQGRITPIEGDHPTHLEMDSYIAHVFFLKVKSAEPNLRKKL
ncbi:hypothetical protein [Pseudomonas graminis]|jgi:hypothetical protein|uniref:hypothetical protein n=1 Tax=Pseudomonas graminis TaxID=158627 RepID=UPI0011143C13|nr:hypothetical protein [Pseudomonas graminis]